MGQVTQAGHDITQILAGLRREVDQMPATHRSVRKLVEEATIATSDLSFQTTATLDAVERVAASMEHAVPMLSQKLATGIESIDAAAGQLKKTGEEAQLTLKSAQPLLDKSESAAREANDVLGAAKRVWPLSDSFKDTGDGMLPIDSFEARGKGYAR
jgi:methyl-accepting chemotaxis protein